MAVSITDMAILNFTDVASIGLTAAFVYGLAQMAPLQNEGALADVRGETSLMSGGGSADPMGIVTGALAPVTGIRSRTPLAACGMPQGVGISSRLLPPTDADTFDSSEFTKLDAQGLVAKNYLTATSRIGFPTVDTTRCKNNQLRSDPVVPVTLTVNNVPWGVSGYTGTEKPIERPFEVQTIDSAEYMQQTKKNAMGK